LRGRTAIVVDDGLAAGFTMQAAVRAVRRQQPARIVVAVPVGAQEAVRKVALDADDVVCLHVVEPFVTVEACYARFDGVSDDEICDLIGANRVLPDASLVDVTMHLEPARSHGFHC
jgi:predicted phosphoribosyltransferase